MTAGWQIHYVLSPSTYTGLDNIIKWSAVSSEQKIRGMSIFRTKPKSLSSYHKSRGNFNFASGKAWKTYSKCQDCTSEAE